MPVHLKFKLQARVIGFWGVFTCFQALGLFAGDAIAQRSRNDIVPVIPPHEEKLSLSQEEEFVNSFGFSFELAQNPSLPLDLKLPAIEPLPPKPPSTAPQPPPESPPQLPPPEQLLPLPGTVAPPDRDSQGPPTITVDRFEVVGSTILSQQEVDEITKDYVGRPISFSELLQARSRITERYTQEGYITTGALLPPQELAPTNKTVIIQVVEGRVEAINIKGTRRLHPGYIESRLALASESPLNIDRLREGLQLLQLDPLIRSISAELSTGTQMGTNILNVTIAEADTFNLDVVLNNNRSPNVGSFRRGVEAVEANFLGIGDRLSATYGNTDGSNSLDLSYTVPLNPRNGTLRLAFGTSRSRIIEPAFEVLDITSRSRYYELSLRQPLQQSPTQEFAVGVTLSHQNSQTALGILPDLDGFPLSPEADSEGRTKLTALRFFQEWVNRSDREVFALRSQFSIGLPWLNSTQNPDLPDSNFLTWRGQAQWVRLLAPETLLLVRTDLQLADRPLLALEQFGLGGADTARGYRQDYILADNGWSLSAEGRIPILRVPSIKGLLQISPFFDFGLAGNRESDKTPQLLAGIGLGLRWEQSDRLQMRLDWGIPLTGTNTQRRTWQDNGLYFSLRYRLL